VQVIPWTTSTNGGVDALQAVKVTNQTTVRLVAARNVAPSRTVVRILDGAILALEDEDNSFYPLGKLSNQMRSGSISPATFATQWKVDAQITDTYALQAKSYMDADLNGGSLCTSYDQTLTAFAAVQAIMNAAVQHSVSSATFGRYVAVSDLRDSLDTGFVPRYTTVKLLSTIPVTGVLRSARFAITVSRRLIDVCVSLPHNPPHLTPFLPNTC
jgi:hypothetical protein